MSVPLISSCTSLPEKTRYQPKFIRKLADHSLLGFWYAILLVSPSVFSSSHLSRSNPQIVLILGIDFRNWISSSYNEIPNWQVLFIFLGQPKLYKHSQVPNNSRVMYPNAYLLGNSIWKSKSTFNLLCPKLNSSSPNHFFQFSLKKDYSLPIAWTNP